MNEVRFKVGGKAAREIVAAIATSGAPWYAKSQLANLLEHIDELGIQISIKKAARKHTTNQSGYYHAMKDLLAKHLGMEPEELHNHILIKWGGAKEIAIGDDVVVVPARRSKESDVESYSELIETLVRVAAFCGYVLPSPEQL